MYLEIEIYSKKKKSKHADAFDDIEIDNQGKRILYSSSSFMI